MYSRLINSRGITVRTVNLTLTLTMAAHLLACASSGFTGSSKKSDETNNKGAESGTDGANVTTPQNATDANPAGPQNATDSANGAGTGTDGGNAGKNAVTDASACTSGCCPSQKIAFVDCSHAGGAAAPVLNKGKFDIAKVDCEQSRGLVTLSTYDTVFYYGPLNMVGGAALPAGVNAALEAGTKVIAVPTPGGLLSNFYGLTFEVNIEFLETLGMTKISAPNTNAMSSAFRQAQYSKATITHFQWAGAPFINSGAPVGWCSDLVWTADAGLRRSTFHSFLLDNAQRKGLLVVATMVFPPAPGGRGSNFDFNEPFLAAHLQQKWDRKGNSKACGMTCNPMPGTTQTFLPPTGVGKPVIYLYPTKEQDIHVQLHFDGDLVTTYPQYDVAAHGWKVRARPDGQLTDLRDKQEYSYIYWNGNSRAFKPNFDQGFVVKGEDTRAFLQTTLKKLGLSVREANDMIVYWLPYMERHPYNLINFAQSSYTDIARLDVTPKPDAMLRVFMQFKKLDQPIVVPPQILTPFERRGFTVVEWGGTEIGGDWHVIQ